MAFNNLLADLFSKRSSEENLPEKENPIEKAMTMAAPQWPTIQKYYDYLPSSESSQVFTTTSNTIPSSAWMENYTNNSAPIFGQHLTDQEVTAIRDIIQFCGSPAKFIFMMKRLMQKMKEFQETFGITDDALPKEEAQK